MHKKSIIISIVILSFTLALTLAISQRKLPVVVETNLENLPIQIGEFEGVEDSFPDNVYRALNAAEHVYRHYRSSNGKQVDLYIGYYGTARGGRTGHHPYACLPGAGWGIIESYKIQLKADYCPEGLKVNYILARKGETYEVMLHWYQSDGTKILDTGLKQNIQRFLGRLLYNRNDGAYIQISATTKGEGIEEAGSLVKYFAEKILTLLPQYWPVEK